MSNRKKCNSCSRERQRYDYYRSESIMFSDGLVPVCKSCLKEMIDENDIESVKSTLQKIDKPFVAKLWVSAEEKEGDVTGNYFRMINSLQQYKGLGWSDSDFEGEESADIYKHRFDDVEEVEEIETDNGRISLNRDIVTKFGSGFTNREYLQMEKFYIDMSLSHDINTPQLRKQLVYMCKLQIQMDRALEAGDANDFKKYNDSYENILKSSALAPRDRKSSDESVGLRSFSTIFEEVEKLGYVEPKPVEERRDLVDVAILSHLNYIRQLIGRDKLIEVPQEIQEEIEGTEGIVEDD